MLLCSNFSYATQLMFCEMSDDSRSCECTHNDHEKFDGISLTQERTKCCSEETTELSNSNTLMNFNTGQEHTAVSKIALYFTFSDHLSSFYNISLHFLPYKSHLPEIDITVFTSSLLI